MCGISGIAHPGKGRGAWGAALRTMTAALAHRGPDEDGFFEAPGVSLGMRRLRVIDLTSGSQPISNEDNTLSIVCNGEIYRYEALQESLRQKGHTLKTHSDVEVILHLYEEYGLDCFNYFDGMFAFALWDARRERLIVARDRFGIKPLFYSRPAADGSFVFASELAPLLEFPTVTRTVDLGALDQFFSLSYITHPQSVYADVRKLRPGHYLISEKGHVKEVPYWDLDVPAEIPDRDAARARLDQTIASAVQSMMRSDVPLGAFLSGGLDSSTIVYHMAQYARKPIHTFSVGFSEGGYDESGLARLTAERLGTEHHEIIAQPDDVRELPTMAIHFGEPFADASQIPTYLVSRLARDTVTVCLSGDGGDEILGGYETYCASLIARQLRAVPDIVRRTFLAMSEHIPVSLDRHISLDYRLRRFLDACHTPPLVHHASWRQIYTTSLKQKMYAPSFLAGLNGHLKEPVFAPWAALVSDDAPGSPLTRYQRLDIRTYLVDNNLTKVDRMSMAHSLEVRIPLLDIDVVRAAFQLPTQDRVRGLSTKIALRQIMRGRLPDPVLRMRKRGFGVPMGLWFNGPLATYVNDQLRPERLARTGLLNPAAVQEILSMHRSGRANYGRQLWNLLCFLSWHENVEQGRVLV